MYALSSTIFVTVLALLLITNFSPDRSGKERAAAGLEAAGADAGNRTQKRRRNPEAFRKGLLVAAAFAIVVSVSFTTYKHFTSSGSNQLYVYNWGEYIDESVIDEFE